MPNPALRHSSGAAGRLARPPFRGGSSLAGETCSRRAVQLVVVEVPKSIFVKTVVVVVVVVVVPVPIIVLLCVLALRL